MERVVGGKGRRAAGQQQHDGAEASQGCHDGTIRNNAGASAIECPYNFTTTTTGPTAGVTAGRSLTLPGTGTPWATTATEAPRHD